MRVSVRSLLVPAGLLALLSLGSPVAAASALRLGHARVVGSNRIAFPVRLERGTGKVAALNFTLRYNDAARLVPCAVVPGPVVKRASADLASGIDLQAGREAQTDSDRADSDRARRRVHAAQPALPGPRTEQP
jgi:hypothetical protein